MFSSIFHKEKQSSEKSTYTGTLNNSDGNRVNNVLGKK